MTTPDRPGDKEPPAGPRGGYALKRDGQVIHRAATYDDCWMYLADHVGYSCHHALTHEGYSIEPHRDEK